MQQRQLIILAGDNAWLSTQIEQIKLACKQQVLLLSDNFQSIDMQKIPTHTCSNLLGQEFACIIYDATTVFKLEHFAILVGTLQQAGCLYLLLPEWQQLTRQIDHDSIRWNNCSYATTSPNFYQYFKNTVQQYGFDVYQQQNTTTIPLTNLTTINNQIINKHITNPSQATADQLAIIQQIYHSNIDIHIITAARGRGKSALAGMLADLLLLKYAVVITAPNYKSVNTLFKHSSKASELVFMAPDNLLQQVASTEHYADYLIIDEAAMLPIPMLIALLKYFPKVILLTTVHGYEGTGRGFIFKFMQNIDRAYQHYQLTKPLRWLTNDPLELFLNQLLLLDIEDKLALPSLTQQTAKSIIENYQLITYTTDTLTSNLVILQQLYALLMLSHYKTNSTDLRRLFDANAQSFICLQQDQQIIAALWLIAEGGMSAKMTDDIYTGKRRPRGNLVPQLLCWHMDHKQICQLKSLRISRIAVLPIYQRQGLATKLMDYLQQTASIAYDLLSTSFGYTDALANFWQANNFTIVRLGEHLEAHSGCYNAVALYPLTDQAKLVVQQLQLKFLRNLPFTEHPLLAKFTTNTCDHTFTNDDYQSIMNFILYQKDFTSIIPALKRCLKQLNRTEQQRLDKIMQLYVLHPKDLLIKHKHKQKINSIKQVLTIFFQSK